MFLLYDEVLITRRLHMRFPCNFSIYIYMENNGSFPPLFSRHLPFLKWLWWVSMFHTQTFAENTSTTYIFLYRVHLPSLSYYDLLLNMTCLHTLSVIVCVCSCFIGLCLGVLSVNMLYFNHTPSVFLPYPFLLKHCSTDFSAFHCLLIYFNVFLFFPFSPSFL
jgi:hypothetical protein